MSIITTATQVATPAVGVILTAILGYVARLLGSGRFDRVAADIGQAAPAVEAAVDAAETVPAVKQVEVDVEARVRAEAERLNAATHGAIDAVAGELAKVLPAAIERAVLNAHAAVPASPVAPAEPAKAVPAPVAVSEAETAVPGPVAAVRTNVPADVAVVKQ